MPVQLTFTWIPSGLSGRSGFSDFCVGAGDHLRNLAFGMNLESASCAQRPRLLRLDMRRFESPAEEPMCAEQFIEAVMNNRSGVGEPGGLQLKKRGRFGGGARGGALPLQERRQAPGRMRGKPQFF
jgi:hypothetical protein